MDSWGQMNLFQDMLPLLLPSEFNSSLLRTAMRILIEKGMGVHSNEVRLLQKQVNSFYTL